MAKKVNYTELVKFINSRNCVLCCNLIGEECTIEYQKGRLIRSETKKYNLPLAKADNINGIPVKINCKQHIIIKGWLTTDTKLIKKYTKKNIKSAIDLYLKSKTDVTKEEDTKTKQHVMFVASELVEIEDYYEWYDEVSEETFKTNNNSSYCNKLNLLDYLGFEVLPHSAITSAIDKTEGRLQEIVEEIKQTTNMRNRILDSFVMKYNDTPYVNMLKGKTKGLKITTIKFEFPFVI